MSTALQGMPDIPYSVPDGVMKVKIDALLGTLINEDEEGIYEYFYQESPPPSVETILPPMEEPSAADFPESSFPRSMTDNPLQLAPKPEPPQNDSATARLNKKTKPNPSSSDSDNSDTATRLLNPSGY
jgi:penicillin-binding protein 1A